MHTTASSSLIFFYPDFCVGVYEVHNSGTLLKLWGIFRLLRLVWLLLLSSSFFKHWPFLDRGGHFKNKISETTLRPVWVVVVVGGGIGLDGECYCPNCDLKGTPSKTESGLKMQKMCKYFHLQALYGCSINIPPSEIPSCSEFELLWAQLCWFARYQ